MYDEDDFRQLEAQIQYRINLQREQAQAQWGMLDGVDLLGDEESS